MTQTDPCLSSMHRRAHTHTRMHNCSVQTHVFIRSSPALVQEGHTCCLNETIESINPLCVCGCLSALQHAGDIKVSSSTWAVLVGHQGTFRMGKQNCHCWRRLFGEMASLPSGAERDHRRAGSDEQAVPQGLWQVAI